MYNNMTRDCETTRLRDGQRPEVSRPEVPRQKEYHYEETLSYNLCSICLGIMYKELRRDEPKSVLANGDDRRGLV